MALIYAVIFKHGAWRLFKGGEEIASFTTYGQAERAARRAATAMSNFGFAAELLLQNRWGELRSERFAGAPELTSSMRASGAPPLDTVLNVH